MTARGAILFDIDGTLIDLDGAHAAGIACVGVAGHHFGVEQMRGAGADYALASLQEALPL